MGDSPALEAKAGPAVLVWPLTLINVTNGAKTQTHNNVQSSSKFTVKYLRCLQKIAILFSSRRKSNCLQRNINIPQHMNSTRSAILLYIELALVLEEEEEEEEEEPETQVQ